MVKIEDLERFHLETCMKALNLVKPKGEDYSLNDSEDTLASIRLPHTLGATQSDAHTALVHIIEKVSRLISINEKNQINFESLDNNVGDLINYVVYFRWFKEEENRKPKFIEEKTSDKIPITNIKDIVMSVEGLESLKKIEAMKKKVYEAGRINIGKSEKEEDN